MTDVLSILKNLGDVFITYIIPIVSFSFSLIALNRSSKSKKIENRIQELELSIKEHKAKEIEDKKNTPQAAKIEARIIKVSKNNYQMKIWNSGNAKAYNINASIPDEYQIPLSKGKLPYDYLEPGNSFEELVVIHFGSAEKFYITTEWEDEDGIKHSYEQLRSR